METENSSYTSEAVNTHSSPAIDNISEGPASRGSPEEEPLADPVQEGLIPKTVEQLADEVLEGKWDKGEKRKELLKAAGYDYYAVQCEINRRFRVGPSACLDPALEKYMQKGGNCRGHWKGNPELNGEPLPCWICWYGCFVLSILYARKEEPTEANVRKLVNENGDVVWDKANIEHPSDTIQDHSIARVSYRASHYVYVECCNEDGTYSGFDPVTGPFKDWKGAEFRYSHKIK